MTNNSVCVEVAILWKNRGSSLKTRPFESEKFFSTPHTRDLQALLRISCWVLIVTQYAVKLEQAKSWYALSPQSPELLCQKNHVFPDDPLACLLWVFLWEFARLPVEGRCCSQPLWTLRTQFQTGKSSMTHKVLQLSPKK